MLSTCSDKIDSIFSSDKLDSIFSSDKLDSQLSMGFLCFTLPDPLKFSLTSSASQGDENRNGRVNFNDR